MVGVYSFSDFVEAVGPGGERTIPFTVSGVPRVQERPRTNYKYRTNATIYDPCSTAKKAWATDFQRFIAAETGFSGQFPFFPKKSMEHGGYHLTIHFYLLRRKADYSRKKMKRRCCLIVIGILRKRISIT
jgi:hypothetical protein